MNSTFFVAEVFTSCFERSFPFRLEDEPFFKFEGIALVGEVGCVRWEPTSASVFSSSGNSPNMSEKDWLEISMKNIYNETDYVFWRAVNHYLPLGEDFPITPTDIPCLRLSTLISSTVNLPVFIIGTPDRGAWVNLSRATAISSMQRHINTYNASSGKNKVDLPKFLPCVAVAACQWIHPEDICPWWANKRIFPLGNWNSSWKYAMKWSAAKQ